MRSFFISILVLSLLGISSSFAESDTASTAPLEAATNGTPQTYDTYKQLIAEHCDNPDKEWKKAENGGALIQPPDYPEFTTIAVNTHIGQAIAADTRGILSYELDMNRIGGFDGIKTVEIARIEYRERMNDLFGCAVIDSRLQILADLQKKIATKFPTQNNELKTKLDNESRRLKELRDPMKCTIAKDSAIPVETQIRDTATLQFCHFSYYLQYLQSHLESNNDAFMRTEMGIGTGNGTKMATDTEAWRRALAERQNQIKNELAQAQSTLPRAIRTFQEMKRTYPIHIMLTILLDDYIRLRENLNRYLNANSQLFEKMYNAQDKNAR